jgi:predicted transposase YbfD/YdcC
VLAVKRNQPTLYDGIAWFFFDNLDDCFQRVPVSRFETHEEGHGREETRTYFVCPVPDGLPDRKRWPDLAAISETTRDGKTSIEQRYYILSRKLSGRRFAAAVRGHWSIENRLHWQLDVTFQEDQCRLRRGHPAANFSILRRMALSMIEKLALRCVTLRGRSRHGGTDEGRSTEIRPALDSPARRKHPWCAGVPWLRPQRRFRKCARLVRSLMSRNTFDEHVDPHAQRHDGKIEEEREGLEDKKTDPDREKDQGNT